MLVDREILNWNTVSTYGGGSSFDNQNINAGQMKVLERWRGIKNIEAYRNLFLNDKELCFLIRDNFWEDSHFLKSIILWQRPRGNEPRTTPSILSYSRLLPLVRQLFHIQHSFS